MARKPTSNKQFVRDFKSIVISQFSTNIEESTPSPHHLNNIIEKSTPSPCHPNNIEESTNS